MKRKRGREAAPTSPKRTKTKSAGNQAISDDSRYTDPTVLRLYYPQVLTLRGYLCQACKSSKGKRRRISNYGKTNDKDYRNHDDRLANVLDTILVGCYSLKDEPNKPDYRNELVAFSQQMSGSTVRSTVSESGMSFSEIVDFAIWLLFKSHTSGHRPPHILCHGFMHAGSVLTRNLGSPKTTTMSGIISYGPNEHVERLKSNDWSGLPALMGQGGTWLLAKLLTHSGMFMPLGEGRSNYLQISGTSLSELRALDQQNVLGGQKLACGSKTKLMSPAEGAIARNVQVNSNNSIKFVRHRMLYRKPALNAKRDAHFGLSHIHVLNRARSMEDPDADIHVMKYVFPRQFGLHNAFTSHVDPKNTGQPFQDYTLREQEIRSAASKTSRSRTSLPKRLRGECETLISKLRIRHGRCAYAALLHHYCPAAKAADRISDAVDGNVMSLATSPCQVSAFCRAVVAKVFPSRFWGDAELGLENKSRIMHEIDRFVKLNRYESLMLHEVLQHVKISCIPWLSPPNEKSVTKLAASDFSKRKEIFSELVYYLFDSFIIPLIGSNFHVTESSTCRNRLFYFRHDVWNSLSEPTMNTMKMTMFEELGQTKIKKTLSRRAIGTSRVRLLPKETGLRPIINLRRRVQRQINGRPVLGRSINSILTPAFHVLNFEKIAMPKRLGSSMFSADDIYPRLQQFRTQLEQSGEAGKPLYFAKVDVKSCFDTIPQKALIGLLNGLLSRDAYSVTRHAEVKALEDYSPSEEHAIYPKAIWKFLGRAQDADDTESFAAYAVKEAANKLGTVFVDSVTTNQESRAGILSLLQEHVERNVVQIGKKFYRQKTGIPQGSIVSSLLCSFFYADLEREVLGFVQDGKSVLLRLIDDFLLISSNHDVASRFIRVMHEGIPEYGLSVKSEKTKVNFDVKIGGEAVARLPASTDFPYCGNAINTQNLNITKDETRRQHNNAVAAITVEYSRLPGQSFYRKTFNILKLHMHAMHLCTRHNHVETVIANLFRAFADTAERCFQYIRSLPRRKQPSCILIIKTINDVIDFAFGLMQRKNSKNSEIRYECAISKAETRWLACHGFGECFQRRQTGFGGLLSWLRRQKAEAGLALPRDRQALEEIVRRTG